MLPGFDAGFLVPSRENVPTHRCLCVLYDARVVPTVQDRCKKKGLPLDAPFCDICSDRHPDLARLVTVTVWNPMERNKE